MEAQECRPRAISLASWITSIYYTSAIHLLYAQIVKISENSERESHEKRWDFHEQPQLPPHSGVRRHEYEDSDNC